MAGQPESHRAGSPPGDFLSDLDPWQTRICGPNSVYMLLGMHGIEVEFSDLKRRFFMEDTGVDMPQLRDVASECGLPAEIRYCTLEELQSCSTPVIAHMERKHRNSSAIYGHFVVVLYCEGDQVVALDGTTGEKIPFRADAFERFWTGHILVSATSDGTVISARTVMLISVLAGALLITSVYRRRTGSTVRAVESASGRGATVAMIGLVFCSVTTCLANEDPDDDQNQSSRGVAVEELPEHATLHDSESWRKSSRSGLNALYLMLRIRGFDPDYEALRETIERHPNSGSFAALRTAGIEAGMQCDIRKCTPDDFTSPEWFPLVAHTDSRAGEGSGFVFLLNLTDRAAFHIDTASVIMHEVPMEQFRRRWTGFVLVESPPPQSTWQILAVLLLIGVLTAAYYSIRVRSRSPLAVSVVHQEGARNP